MRERQRRHWRYRTTAVAVGVAAINYCYGVERSRPTVILRIDSSIDFGPVTACVIARDKARACSRFELLRTGRGIYTRRVRVDFPRRSRGRYTVAWRTRWGRLGPRVSLRR